METISYSEVSAYRRCPKSWEYRYKQRIKRKFKGIRLLIGSILHEMLNAYIERKIDKNYDGNDPWDVLEEYNEKYSAYFEEERDKYGDIIGNCGQIFEGYLRKYRKDELTYEASEIKIELDLSQLGSNAIPVIFIGFVDKIAVDMQKRRWIMDHKFMKSIPNADERFSELQLLLYVWTYGMQAPKDKIDGVCWDYARSKPPTVPEVLKNGQLSKRKNLDCDPYTYLKTVRANGLKDADYVDMLEHLEGKEDTFFERVFLPLPGTEMIVEVVSDFLQTTAEIQAKRENGRCARSMSPFNCATCDFRPLCEAEVRGLDADFIRKSEYEERGSYDGD
ncbi:MAG TPA: PD-(D/E)XK nuclease family protein [Dehalococcoidia bacterium]|nr:PD-(D/E)XK nuclease family protein [Dehalococcoidia bacterium]